MRTRYLVTALVIAVVGLIAGLVYYASSPVAPLAKPVAATAKAEPKPEPTVAELGKMETVMTPPKTFGGRLSPESTSPDDFSSNPKRDPEEQSVLDLVAERQVPDRAKVERLLSMIPTLQPDAQALAMENATALIKDTEYLGYRTRLIQIAKSPEMREAVMNDSLTRGEELRLPNLLELMRTSTSEEEKKDIRAVLEAYLDKDYGPQPAQWEAPLRKWVAENTER